MDTRFWGPSGWRLLHLITFTYENEPSRRESVKELFSMLPFVLPCKFCRASFADYLEQEPLEPALASQAKLERWLYKVHNLVNGKLRKQGLLKEANPSFESVKKVYEERIQQGCVRTSFEGWDFLFSIAENHPFSRASRVSSEMPDMPEEIWRSKDPVVKNRWNILKPEERIPYYIRFWKAVGPSLPFLEWREAWKTCSPKTNLLKSRSRWMKELWRIRCCLEEKLELVNREKFDSVCARLQEHKSGCNKTKRARTCRRIRMTKKKNN
jgi:hypothetical protein